MRRDGSRQTKLAKFLAAVEVNDFTHDDALVVGNLLGRSQTSDAVDAHLVALALHLPDSIITAVLLICQSDNQALVSLTTKVVRLTTTR